jgi:hypothetical protein
VYTQQTKVKEKMKFLVISEMKEVYYSISATERKKIDDSNSIYFNNAVKGGAILEVYSMPGWNRSNKDYVFVEM